MIAIIPEERWHVWTCAAQDILCSVYESNDSRNEPNEDMIKNCANGEDEQQDVNNPSEGNILRKELQTVKESADTRYWKSQKAIKRSNHKSIDSTKVLQICVTKIGGKKNNVERNGKRNNHGYDGWLFWIWFLGRGGIAFPKIPGEISPGGDRQSQSKAQDREY